MNRNTIACALGGLTLSAFLCFSSESAAQESAAPPPSRGFQLALRTGYSLPMGKASGADGDDLSKSFGGQVPLIADIGGKLSENVFLGGYVGVGIGQEGSELKKLCGSGGVSCSAASFRIGAQIHYQFLPAQKANPWLGYGIGVESAALAAEGNGQKATIAIAGFEFAHLMGGVDFRLGKTFGIGPFIDFSVGQYDRMTLESAGTKESKDIDKKAMHQWLTFGVRGVFWP